MKNFITATFVYKIKTNILLFHWIGIMFREIEF